MHAFILFLIAISASVLGALTGIGGGVIVKPVVDAAGLLSSAAANFLCGCMVLSMSVVSLIRNRKGPKPPMKFVTPLAFGAAAQAYARVQPTVAADTPTYKKEILISYEDTPCFGENRHTLRRGGSFVMDYAPSVYICLEGKAVITGEGYEKPIRRGDYFYLPYAAEGKFTVSAQKKAVLIECLPSKQT